MFASAHITGCPEGLPGWGTYRWFYGFATEEYTTFAALMAAAAVTTIFVFSTGDREQDAQTRKVLFAAFVALLISTTLYGEVAGDTDCARQVLVGSSASLLLAAGSGLVVIAIIPLVFGGSDERPLRLALGGLVLVAVASAYALGAYSAAVLTVGSFGGSWWWLDAPLLWCVLAVQVAALSLLVWALRLSPSAYVNLAVVWFASLTVVTYVAAAWVTASFDIPTVIVFGLVQLRVSLLVMLGVLAIQAANINTRSLLPVAPFDASELAVTPESMKGVSTTGSPER